MVELARAIGASPVFWTPPPPPKWSDQFKSPTHFEIQRQICDLYLRMVERVACDLNIPMANFWRTFPDMVKKYPGIYFNKPDVYHSNEKSQPIIAKGIAEIIRPIFEGWSKSKKG
jgi:hypothetical protein